MTEEILFETSGALGIITLNRPKALNALTEPMVLAMRAQLDAWATNPAVGAVVVLGEGEKGFCAGGDIRALYDSGKAGTPDAQRFFANEYRNNLAVARFPKPYIAIIDGITMGGGVGISVHAPYRVATERTVFAMPETGIGLIPDVGGSYFLPRLKGRLGMFLGLTGTRLKRADSVLTGIATHAIPASAVDALVSDLANADLLGKGKEAVESLLRRHSYKGDDAPIAQHLDDIDRLFEGDDVEAILARLDADGGAWAKAQADTLRQKSPTSLCLTAREIREGALLSLPNALRLEYRLVSRILKGHDFYEGVRAVIIDKDNAPQWSPDALAGTTPDLINPYFADMGADELEL